jgi:hypothetical protein
MRVIDALSASPAPAPTTTNSAPAAPDTHAALRQLGNRLVGSLHGCLKTNAFSTGGAARRHSSSGGGVSKVASHFASSRSNSSASRGVSWSSSRRSLAM